MKPSFAIVVATSACLAMSCMAHAQQAQPADRFIDSVGVNLHLHYDRSAYADFPKVLGALNSLGIHHVRDGLVDSSYEPYYAALRSLANDGIHALLIADPKQDATMLRQFPARVPSAVEGVEAPNELDAGNPNWLAVDRATEDKIAAAFDGTSIQTVAPSLTRTESFAQLGAVACPCLFGNLHNYFAGRNPGTPGWGDDGYGSYRWALQHAHEAFGDKPLYTTETGYINDPARQDGIPEEIAGKYTTRLLLEQFLHGIRRTYLYELIDTEIPEQNVHDRFGLLRSDFTPRPSFTAVAGLIALLRDGATPHSKVPSTWHLETAGKDVHHLALEKRNGDVVLFLWREVSSYDVPTRKPIIVQPVKVTLTLPAQVTTTVRRFAPDGSLQDVSAQGTTLNIDDNVTAVILRSHR